MSRTNEPIDTHLASLARSSLAAAPLPALCAVIRILAERRRAEIRSRRLLALLAVASAAPVLIVLAAWLHRPADAGGSLLVAALLAFALIPAVGSIARMVGVSAPARWSAGTARLDTPV